MPFDPAIHVYAAVQEKLTHMTKRHIQRCACTICDTKTVKTTLLSTGGEWRHYMLWSEHIMKYYEMNELSRIKKENHTI